MGISEFSDGFDVLLNSYANQIAIGNDTSRHNIALDEYEKSLFLTDSQETLVKSLYTGRNSLAAGFEETEELRRYLSPLIEEVNIEPITNSSGTYIGVNSTSKFFTLPEELWFITYEAATVGSEDNACINGSTLEVVPVTQDQYHRIKKNPFRGPSKRRVLRLDLSDGIVELVSKYAVSNYYIRYLREPEPIILTDLTDTDLSIKGRKKPQTCQLHEAVHQRVLENAVIAALRSKGALKEDK